MRMNPDMSIFRQRLAAHRLTPKERPSPAGGQEFPVQPAGGGGGFYPWWGWWNWFPYYPYNALNYYYPSYALAYGSPFYGQTYFDGVTTWVWAGYGWVPVG